MKLTFALRDKKNALKLSTKTLERFIERIKTDTKDGAVARRRKQLSYGDYLDGDDRQNPSHLIYPSAEFKKDDNDNLRMKTFNGVVALTVDKLESQEDIDAVKRAAQILHYTLAAFVGHKGSEVIILVRIEKSEGTYQSISGPYSEISGPYPEISGPYSNSDDRSAEQEKNSAGRKNNSAGRKYFFSEQKNISVGQNEPYSTEEEADVLCREGHRLASAIYQAILPKPIRKEAATVRSCFYMPLDPQPYYNPKAMALPVNEKPLAALKESEQRSLEPSLEQIQTDLLQDSEEASNISRETMQLIDFLNKHYQFRYNTIMGYTEYKDNKYPYFEWKPVDDRVLKGMTMKVRLGGINARDNDVRRYVQSNMIPVHDPILDYLWEQYEKWDGKDHIRKLARTVPTDNPYWENWFYTWFLGMVRQWQVSNLAKYGNQAVPLLISTQGWNKTTFCEQLLPPELSFGYTGNLQIEDKKQVLQQMAQMLLINLDEFNQISPRTQQGFLKNIITLSSVKIKRPYGRHVEDFPRRASFIATTNQPDVLADPSGSRRFLGIQLTGPIDVSTPPNYEQLYAQAMQALHHRERYYFGPAETQLIMESNRKFSVKTAAEQFFLDYFEPAEDTTDGTWMSATAILDFLKNKVGVSLLKPVTVSTFGRKLSAIPGLQKHETSSNTTYLVKKKPKK